MTQSEAAGEALGLHKPRWSQDRDDPVGMWVCGCGKTFAPDDFEGYHGHLACRPHHSVSGQVRQRARRGGVTPDERNDREIAQIGWAFVGWCVLLIVALLLVIFVIKPDCIGACGPLPVRIVP